jgi:hypothetical protein
MEAITYNFPQAARALNGNPPSGVVVTSVHHKLRAKNVAIDLDRKACSLMLYALNLTREDYGALSGVALVLDEILFRLRYPEETPNFL